MKKCSDCKVEMIENLGIRADEPISVDNIQQLYIIKNADDYYGERLGEETSEDDNFVKCRICPNCGKVELFIDPKILK